MEKFNHLYYLENGSISDDLDMSTFLFCGKNRDYWFTACVHETCEKVDRVMLSESFRKEYIDYDREQGLYLVSW